jgi:hypothetical protein
MARSSKYGNGPSGSINKQFLDQLIYYQFLKMDSASWRRHIIRVFLFLSLQYHEAADQSSRLQEIQKRYIAFVSFCVRADS